jgi:hypothetical protein
VEGIRAVLGIIVGYLISSLVAMGVASSLWKGEVDPADKTVIMYLLALAVGSAVGGFVCTLIVGSANHPAIYITIGIMIAMAVYSYANGLSAEPAWYVLVGLIAQAGGFMIGASASAYKTER